MLLFKYTLKCISPLIKKFLYATENMVIEYYKWSKKDINDYEMFSDIDTPTITLPCQIRGEHRERNKKIVSAKGLRFLP